MSHNDPNQIRTILGHPVWAAIGLSDNRARPAYDVAGWLGPKIEAPRLGWRPAA